MTDPNITTIEINGQPIELARGGVYEFGFKLGSKHTTVVARFLRLNGRDLALEPMEGGRIFHRSMRDLENIWDTPHGPSFRA